MNKNTNLLQQFARTQGLLHRYYGHMRAGGMGPNPHRGQGRILAILKLQPEISQRELSYLLDMRKQSLGELLSKLEAKGYITREPSEGDRRVMLIKLTAEGKAAAERLEAEKQEEKDVFALLEPEKQEQLSQLLQQLSDALEAKLADMPEAQRDPRGGCGMHGGHGGHHHGPHGGCGNPRHGAHGFGPHGFHKAPMPGWQGEAPQPEGEE